MYLKYRVDLPPISPLVRRRLLTALPTLFVIVTVTFVLARAAPGGPFRGEEAVPEAVRENLEARYGLDRSIVIQYVRFWGNVLTGSLGPSFSHPERSALQVLVAGLIPSTVVGLAALFVALLIGLGGGTLACVYPRLGPAVSGASLAALALPVFVLGPLLVRSLALGLGWFPSGLLESPLHVVLPALTLGIPVGGALARFWRATLSETMAAPECLAARARGLGEWAVVRRHASPRSIPLLLNYLGPLAAALVTGSVVVEKVFAVPGMGSFYVDGALARDYPLVIGATLVYALALLIVHTVVDLTHIRLDPRLQKEHADWMTAERAFRTKRRAEHRKAYAAAQAEKRKAKAEAAARKATVGGKKAGKGKGSGQWPKPGSGGS